MSGRGRGSGLGGRGRGRGSGLGRGSVETGTAAPVASPACFSPARLMRRAHRRLWQPGTPAARRPVAARRILRPRAKRCDSVSSRPPAVAGARCARHARCGVVLTAALFGCRTCRSATRDLRKLRHGPWSCRALRLSSLSRLRAAQRHTLLCQLEMRRPGQLKRMRSSRSSAHERAEATLPRLRLRR